MATYYAITNLEGSRILQNTETGLLEIYETKEQAESQDYAVRVSPLTVTRIDGSEVDE